MRKTIFEQLEGMMSLSKEIERLDDLLNDKSGIKIEIPPDPFYSSILDSTFQYYTIENYVDEYGFKYWKGRGTCISCNDMRNCLNIDDILILDNPTEDQIITFIEYVANIIYVSKTIELEDRYKQHDTPVSIALRENLDSVLDWLNLEATTFDEKEQVIITEKSAKVTAVAEITSANISYQIVKYNHHTLKGDIEKKKAILLVLSNELEPKRKQLSSINIQLTTNIFYMLNNLNLRHNNRSKKDKNYKEYVAKMKKNKLEEWYDELYQMMLLAFLELEQVERNAKFNELTTCIEA